MIKKTLFRHPQASKEARKLPAPPVSTTTWWFKKLGSVAMVRYSKLRRKLINTSLYLKKMIVKKPLPWPWRKSLKETSWGATPWSWQVDYLCKIIVLSLWMDYFVIRMSNFSSKSWSSQREAICPLSWKLPLAKEMPSANLAKMESDSYLLE